MKSAKPIPIIYFDGVCGLCNRFVDFVIQRDPARIFKFRALQNDGKSLKTIRFSDGNEVLEKSDAVLKVFYLLGGVWRKLSYLRVIPRPIRDAVYDIIAWNRYRIFGKHEKCRIPTPEERERFI